MGFFSQALIAQIKKVRESAHTCYEHKQFAFFLVSRVHARLGEFTLQQPFGDMHEIAAPEMFCI